MLLLPLIDSVCVLHVCRKTGRRKKSKPLGLSNTRACSTLAVSFHVGRSFLALAVKIESIYYLPFSHLILFQCSLTHHCLIYKRPFNIHVCLGDISQTLWRQLEIYWLCVLLQFVSTCDFEFGETWFISICNGCLSHLNYLTFSLSSYVCLRLFLPLPGFLFKFFFDPFLFQLKLL